MDIHSHVFLSQTRMINTKNASLKKVEKSLKIMAIWIPDSIIQQKTATAIKVQ
jgi:hypothetical protein